MAAQQLDNLDPTLDEHYELLGKKDEGISTVSRNTWRLLMSWRLEQSPSSTA